MIVKKQYNLIADVETEKAMMMIQTRLKTFLSSLFSFSFPLWKEILVVEDDVIQKHLTLLPEEEEEDGHQRRLINTYIRNERWNL